jgi:hypothetical protein
MVQVRSEAQRELSHEQRPEPPRRSGASEHSGPPLDAAELRALLVSRGGPHVSLYLTTERRSPAARHVNVVRFENLLGELRDRLARRGTAAAAATQLLECGARLRADYELWAHPKDGLAVFLTPDGARCWRADERFAERIYIGERFHTKRLLPLVDGAQPCYVLALSKGAVRLFRCAGDILEELHPQGLPRSLAEALRFDEPAAALQVHTLGGARAGRAGDAVFHSQSGADLQREELALFCRRVDQALRPLLAAQQPRLVLAAVEELWPVYRAANSCARLVEGIRGNPDGVAPHELRARAREALCADDDRLERTVAAFERLAQPGRASDSPEIVVPAAVQGRVERLLVAVDRELWGRFDPDTHAVQRHEAPGPRSEDLSDLAAAQAWLNSAEVIAAPGERMPRGALLAATFRYADPARPARPLPR